MRVKDGCFCLVFEWGFPARWKFWKFKSRLMNRYGFGPVAVCIIKMSLKDYSDECEGGNTEWRKN